MVDDLIIHRDFLAMSVDRQESLLSHLRNALFAASDEGHSTASLEFARLGKLLRPDDPWWLYRFAEALREVGRRTEAEPLLLYVHPRKTKMRYLVEVSLGELYRDSGRLEESERWFKLATETAPGDTAAWVYLGGFLARSQRFEEASVALDRGLEAEGDVDEVWLNLGLNKRGLGDYEAAKRCFQKAIEVSPTPYTQAILALADIELAIGVRSTAKNAIEFWAATMPGPVAAGAVARPLIGKTRLGGDSGIHRDFLAMPVGEQKHLNSHLLEALSDANEGGRTTAALEIARLGSEIQPEDTWWLYQFADGLREVGRRTHAEPLLLYVHPRKTRNRYVVEISLGELYRDSARLADAERWFTRATETAPDDAAPWVYLGGFLTRSQRFAEACNVLEHGLKADGNVDQVWLNLGLARRGLGDYEAAKRCFQKAIEESPTPNSQAILALADIEHAIEVRSTAEKAVEVWPLTPTKTRVENSG